MSLCVSGAQIFVCDEKERRRMQLDTGPVALILAPLKNHALLFACAQKEADVPQDKIDALEDSWEDKGISIPPWTIPYVITRLPKTVCLRHNHPQGLGCSSTGWCTYEHVCIFCGHTNHGVFHKHTTDGTGKCRRLRKFQAQLCAYNNSCANDAPPYSEIVEALRDHKHNH